MVSLKGLEVFGISDFLFWNILKIPEHVSVIRLNPFGDVMSSCAWLDSDWRDCIGT